MPSDDVKMTLRIPKDLNDKLDALIQRRLKSGARRYSKNDAILDAIETLIREEKSGKK